MSPLRYAPPLCSIFPCQLYTYTPTSPTVTSRGYHPAPAEAGRLGVNLRAGPQARDTPEPHPPSRAASRGTTTAEEGKRKAVFEEEDGDEEECDKPERGGWTEDSSVSKAQVCSLVFERIRAVGESYDT